MSRVRADSTLISKSIAEGVATGSLNGVDPSVITFLSETLSTIRLFSFGKKEDLDALWEESRNTKQDIVDWLLDTGGLIQMEIGDREAYLALLQLYADGIGFYIEDKPVSGESLSCIDDDLLSRGSTREYVYTLLQANAWVVPILALYDLEVGKLE